MRREQLGELVNLTLQLTAQRPTAEMPAVELDDLLRKDRELHAEPVVAANDLELARGTVRFAPRHSRLGLALGCLAAFAGGFAATLPLWW